MIRAATIPFSNRTAGARYSVYIFNTMEYFDLFVLRMVSKRILTYINKNNNNL
jgi:hypothetical protein